MEMIVTGQTYHKQDNLTVLLVKLLLLKTVKFFLKNSDIESLS